MLQEKRMTTKIRQVVIAALLLTLLSALVVASPAVGPYQTNDHVLRPTIMRPRPLILTPALPWLSSATLRPISPVPYEIRGHPYPPLLHPGAYTVGAPVSPAAILPSPCRSSWPSHTTRTPVPQPTAPDPYQMSGVLPRWAAYNPLNRVMPGVRAGCGGWR